MDSNITVLVRAPFASGKTSTAQLLYRYFKSNEENISTEIGNKAFIVTAAGNKTEKSWADHWFLQTQASWNTVCSTSTEEGVRYIIIDEAQITYPKDNSMHEELWGNGADIKLLKQRQANIRFIFIGSYGNPNASGGSSTPTDFPNPVISLFPSKLAKKEFGLAYTSDEFIALCEKFKRGRGFDINHEAQNYIFHMTRGHPGIVGYILMTIYQYAKDLPPRSMYICRCTAIIIVIACFG